LIRITHELLILDDNMKDPEIKKWQGHEGPLMESVKEFDVIDCHLCGYRHIIPIPTEKELEQAYQHEYYSKEKPLYIERYVEDIEWWNIVYSHRYEILEQHLSAEKRCLLDIGSGPGFFLLNGLNRGWKVMGIEPSVQAAEHSHSMGLKVDNAFFSKVTAPKLGRFDAINMSEVLEHIPDPAGLLSLVHGRLNDGGIVCIVVPNDFNPLQMVLRDHLFFNPWWVAPPHHINYFNFNSLQKLLERVGFDIVHKESTFPIDMFLLMGDNYIENDEMGRKCHTKRMNFEKTISKSGAGEILTNLYSTLANQGIGREVVIFARKVNP
jgi:SAM-dependent methyltransferase